MWQFFLEYFKHNKNCQPKKIYLFFEPRTWLLSGSKITSGLSEVTLDRLAFQFFSADVDVDVGADVDVDVDIDLMLMLMLIFTETISQFHSSETSAAQLTGS